MLLGPCVYAMFFQTAIFIYIYMYLLTIMLNSFKFIRLLDFGCATVRSVVHYVYDLIFLHARSHPTVPEVTDEAIVGLM